MATKLRPKFEKLEKIRKSILFPGMIIGTIITAGVIFSLKFFVDDKIPIGLEGLITFDIPSSWTRIIAIIYLILGIGVTIFLNNHLKKRDYKLSQEFLEISEDKIYINKYDDQKSFRISDVVNYSNLLDKYNKNVIGMVINLKDGQKIELIHYDKERLEESLRKANINKK